MCQTPEKSKFIKLREIENQIERERQAERDRERRIIVWEQLRMQQQQHQFLLERLERAQAERDRLQEWIRQLREQNSR